MGKSVKAIPDGYHALTPHLVVSDAKKAVAFYQKAFGARELFSFPTPDGGIAHAQLQIGDSVLMLCQECEERGMRSPKKVGGVSSSLFLYVADVDASFEKAVAAGAKSKQPVADMFWGDRYGSVTDPFGHDWEIATHVKDVSPEELQAAMAQET